jgi:hypothetical protein
LWRGSPYLAACSGTSTDPAGVEEPGIGAVLLNLLCEHLGVAHGVECEEGLSKARRKGSLRLSDTLLSTSHLGGVTGDEVVHGLLGAELGDGRKDTTGIASKEDNVLGMAI